MCFVLAKIEECSSASEVVKSLTVLHATRWIAQAWSEVRPETIKKCFRKAGVLSESFQVISRNEEEDPFRDLDEDMGQLAGDDELQCMTEQLHIENFCSADEMIALEEDQATCADLSDDQWEDTFFAELGPSSKSALISGESSQSASGDLTEETSNEESDNESTDELPPPKFHSLPEAIKCLDDIQYFLNCRGYTVQSTELCF